MAIWRWAAECTRPARGAEATERVVPAARCPDPVRLAPFCRRARERHPTEGGEHRCALPTARHRWFGPALGW